MFLGGYLYACSACYLPALLALFIASCSIIIDRITTKHLHTHFIIMKCPQLYFYALIYGAGAFTITFFLPYNKLSLSNAWIEALIVGVTIRAFLNITLFSVPIPNTKETVSLGIQAAIRPIENLILTTMNEAYDIQLMSFLSPIMQHYTDPECVLLRILSTPLAI